MNLQHLEYFISVARTENFSTSARLLSVSQPALSKSISGLESTLGVPLFEKQGRNVRLTEYGKIFATYAAAAINEINAGVKDLEATLLRNSRRLLLASPSGINLFWEAKLVQDFSALEPEVNVGVYHLEYEDMVLAIKQDLVDYGICLEDNFPNDPDIIKLQVGYYPLGALVSSSGSLAAKDTVSFADLYDQCIIGPNNGRQEEFKKYVIEHTGNALQKFDTAPWAELFSRVERNEGVYICALDAAACVATFKSKFLPFVDAGCTKTMYLLCNKYKRSTPTMDSFRAYMKNSYKSKK